MSNIDCILYPPTLNFNYLVQRPQQLMKSFSQLNIPSLYINMPSPHLSQPRGIERPNDKLYLFNDVDPRPFLKNIRPVVYFSAAWHVDMVQQYNPSLTVFDSLDEPSDEFESWKPYYIRAVSQSDMVLTTSDKLYEMACKTNPHTYLVPNACDYDYFSRAAAGTFPVPGDIAGLSGPIIGYIGVVATWLDLSLIERLADEYRDCSVVIIGPLYNVSEVPQRPNIHWLGFKPYEQLAAYAQCFSVGIIPFKQSKMMESVNPIKMWEYLAAGLPVVTTAIPETHKYEELVWVSYDHEEFLNNVHRALYDDDPRLRRLRMEIAEQNSWDHRAQQIIEIVEERLREKGHNPGANEWTAIEPLLEQGFIFPDRNIQLAGVNPRLNSREPAAFNKPLPHIRFINNRQQHFGPPMNNRPAGLLVNGPRWQKHYFPGRTAAAARPVIKISRSTVLPGIYWTGRPGVKGKNIPTRFFHHANPVIGHHQGPNLIRTGRLNIKFGSSLCWRKDLR